MTLPDPTQETSHFPEFVDGWQTPDHLLPLRLHDGSQGNLSLNDYTLILTVDNDGEVNVALGSGVDPKDAGAALASIGLDLQSRD